MDILRDTNHHIIQLLPNVEAVAKSMAEDFVRRSTDAINQKGQFTVVLSGGNTPKIFLDTLAKKEYQDKISWDKIYFFFGDERYISSDNPDSNYYMANHHLFSKIPIPKNHIYRVPIEFGYAKDVAKEYENLIRNFFKISDHQFPNFDLCYLGLGQDGHTASLMPNSKVVAESIKKKKDNAGSHILVTAVPFYSQGIYERITLTPEAINHAITIIFMVVGEDKAEALYQVLSGDNNPEQYPAQLIHGLDHKTLWYLDQPAASKISGKWTTGDSHVEST